MRSDGDLNLWGQEARNLLVLVGDSELGVAAEVLDDGRREVAGADGVLEAVVGCGGEDLRGRGGGRRARPPAGELRRPGHERYAQGGGRT